jgi:predicted aspartyl protease
MRRISSALLALFSLPLFSVAAAAQSAWPEQCKLHGVANFAMTPHGTTFTIPVMVNNVQKNFMLDTGGYASSLNEDVAKELNIPLKRIIGVEHIDAGGKIAMNWVTVKSFRLGNFEGKDFAFVADAASGGAYFDGTLAPDLFRNFDLELDFANQTLKMFKAHECEGRAVYWTPAYISLPIRITDAGHIRVTVQLNGKNVDAILDTGATSSSMSLDDAVRIFDIKPDSEAMAKAENMIGGNGGTLKSYAYGFNTLSLGDITLNNPKIRLYEGSNILRREGVSLVLGMRELRFLHLYVAYKERELYVSVGEKR